MTTYKLNHFTMADAQALIGKTADITELGGDLETKITYPAAQISGIIGHPGPCLVITTAGAQLASTRTGAHLGTRPPEPEMRIGFTWICEVTNIRDSTAQAAAAPPGREQAGYQRGDRVALEHTDDPHTRLRPGDLGTVTSYNPRAGQLTISWDSGSTLAMLLNDGDQVRLITGAPGGPGPSPGSGMVGNRSGAAESTGVREDITDQVTGLSRLLSERYSTCILRPGDKMHLGPQHTAAFIRQTLDAGTYVVCHQTLTYGDKVSGIASDATLGRHVLPVVCLPGGSRSWGQLPPGWMRRVSPA